MKINDPAGQTWRVSRRWVPWRRRLRDVMDSAPDLPVGLGDDPVSAVIGIVVLILMAPFLVLALVAAIEFAAVVVLLPFAVAGRVLFGRHWTVEARRGFRPWWETPAGSWADSRLRIHDVAGAIARGELPPNTLARSDG